MMKIEANVVVIGAGIIGTTIDRELSRHKLETVVVERGGQEGGQGQSKAAGGMIYTGLVMLMSFILKSIMAPDTPLNKSVLQKLVDTFEARGVFKILVSLKDIGWDHSFWKNKKPLFKIDD
jgi:flavin-dependent dehydrogenase